MQFAFVDDADGLSFAPRDRLRRDEVHLRSDAEHRAHRGFEAVFAVLDVGDLVRELVGIQFENGFALDMDQRIRGKTADIDPGLLQNRSETRFWLLS